MRIEKKKVRSLGANIPGVKQGASLIVSVPVDDIDPGRLAEVGFSSIEANVEVLPTGVGKVSTFNADGKIIKREDLPMERVFRQKEHFWNEWHGPYQVPNSKIVDVPYKRYPREFVLPPSVSLRLVEDQNGQLLVVSPAMAFDPASEPLLHVVNLFLELFGFCDLRDAALVPLSIVPTKRLNWQILPAGRMPWAQLKQALEPVIAAQREANKPVVEHRLKTVASYGPEFSAVGLGGFSGYVVFGFPDKGVFVFECADYGNATYVFEGDWEALSKLTKAEILNASLQKERFVHVAKWSRKIDELLGPRDKRLLA